MLLVDAGECIFFRCIWFVSVRRLDEHGNRGCKVGYVKVIADSIHLVENRVGVVKSMHKCRGDIITSFRTQGTSEVTIPPRTVSETGQKNGISTPSAASSEKPETRSLMKLETTWITKRYNFRLILI
jgi:hypothetical protein